MRKEYGLATSITSLNSIPSVKAVMVEGTCDTIRLAMNNNAIQSGSRPYLPDAIEQSLDAGYNVVADCDHTYGQGASGRLAVNTLVKAHIQDIIDRCLEVASLFGQYGDQFAIEPFNEITDPTLQSMLQQVITALRNAGYDGWILYNLLPGEGPQSPLSFTDPKVAGGWHNYFQNATSTTSQLNRTKLFSNAGIWAIETEIGAAYATTGQEYDNYTTTNVGLTTKFFQECYDLGLNAEGNRKAVNLLWMNHNGVNWPYYKAFSNFKLPTKGSPPTPRDVLIQSNVLIPVTVDGTVRGDTPITVPLDDGLHTVSIPQSVNV